MTWYTFVNTNNVSFQFSSFQYFSENSFKTVRQHSFKIIHCLIMRQFSKLHWWYVLSTYYFCLILKKKDITRLNSWNSFFVYICFNYTCFICQKRMTLFTKSRSIHWKGEKVELVIIGVMIRPQLPCIPVAQVNWTILSSALNFWQDVWDYLMHFLRCVNTCNNVYYMYKTEWILVGSHSCSLNWVWHYYSKYWIGILPLVLWSPYPWYYDPLTHGISNPLSMVFSTTYPWYVEPLSMVFWHPFHDNLNPLSMIFWTLYSWYFDPPTHSISIPYPWFIEPTTYGILTLYPWYCYLSIHGISLHNFWSSYLMKY